MWTFPDQKRKGERETWTRYWCHRVFLLAQSSRRVSTPLQEVVGTDVLVCSHTSPLQCYGSREAPLRLSPWAPLFLSRGCWSRPRGHFPDCASFGSSFLMQWIELSTNNQFRHPHLALLWSDALYYFKCLCKHTVEKVSVEKAFLISRGNSQKGTLCTFPKKPHCVEGFGGSNTCLMARFPLGFQIWPKVSLLILSIISIHACIKSKLNGHNSWTFVLEIRQQVDKCYSIYILGRDQSWRTKANTQSTTDFPFWFDI